VLLREVGIGYREETLKAEGRFLKVGGVMGRGLRESEPRGRRGRKRLNSEKGSEGEGKEGRVEGREGGRKGEGMGKRERE
jgi:hypothetical protein